MTNTVCVLTNFRAGGTAFTLLKSEEYDLPYKGELFSHERPWGYGEILAHWEEMENERFGKVPPGTYARPNFDYKQYFIDEVKKGTPACFKLMPDHVVQTWVDYDNIPVDYDVDIAKSADKVYVLYRRDFKAQALSWIALRINGEFGKNGLKHDRKSGDPRGIDFHWNMHVGTEYKVDKVIRKINLNGEKHSDNFFVHQLIEQLKNNYKRMVHIYKQLPNAELVCMEDFYATQPYKKYNHEFDWVNGEPEIPDFDVEGLFK